MFNKDQFIEDCKSAAEEGQVAVRAVVEQAVSDPAAIMRELGTPEKAGIEPIYHSDSLTIINLVWPPYMSVPPHNHKMYAIIGLYAGREDNAFWRKKDREIEIVSGKSIGVGEAVTLGRDIIHSVLNPINKKTAAIHVYGGDFMSPFNDRTQWDSETLKPAPWDRNEVQERFAEFGQRYDQWATRA
ncbi:hypothetical protein [Sneathiella aquimaris]|uniref:hypothetical protein n=1 Tax=Sneathiella aquimaris TaxID=2599305 RepID=UPI00146C2825|nr:hypothetical protein [Sneathiella aquimaris]